MKTDNEKYNEQVKSNTAFLKELKQKLPDFFTKNGEFDIYKFENELKSRNIDELRNGYQLNFVGKDYARRQAGEMPKSVIVPDEKQNNDEGKSSRNLFFTGDNLEVLRHLQSAYADKINIIYIDPPYNTGNDGFAYDDSFEYTDKELQSMFGIDDTELTRLKSIINKSSHSAWLTFMFPRLVLAKHLMSSNGCLFMSIDDNEVSNARLMLNEIFGETQYIATAPRKTGAGSAATNSVSELRNVHDYVLIYAKNKNKFAFKKKIVGKKKYPFEDEYGKFRLGQFQASGSDATRIARPHMYYPIYVTESGELTTIKKDKIVKIILPQKVNGVDGRWMWKPQKFEKDKEKNIYYDGNQIKRKIYLDPKKDQNIYQVEKAWFDNYSNKNGTTHLNEVMGQKGLFSNPKPVELISFLINLVDIKDPLILDFFAGSGTTAESVMQLNQSDGAKRRYILIQKAESLSDPNNKNKAKKGTVIAFKAGYKTIDQIARERIRRAARKIKNDNALTLPKDFDGSFKHYRVVKPTNETLNEIADFDPNNTRLFTNMVDSFSSKELGIPGDATGEQTILTTWLVKDGYTLDTDIKPVKLSNYVAHEVANNRLYIINEGWQADQTQELLNKLGNHELNIQSVVVFGYSFNVAELRELEIGLKQLDNNITLIKRY